MKLKRYFEIGFFLCFAVAVTVVVVDVVVIVVVVVVFALSHTPTTHQ